LKKNPKLYIVAGANGAGKTTSSFSVFPEILKCREYINADSIAKALSPFNYESVSIEAGKIMLKRINDLISDKSVFAFETTLSSKSILGIIKKAQSNNYKVYILFFYLNFYEIAFQRVNARVKEGGHNIPKDVIQRRYFRGLINLMNVFINNCDFCSITDNSGSIPKLVAEIKNNTTQTITVHSLTDWEIIKKYGKKEN
jgi:predicted ABC-type ATPase